MGTFYGNTNDTRGYTEAFINAYTPGYEHVLQEMDDVYGGKTRVDSIMGEHKAYDFLGTIDLKKKVSRFEDIPIDDMVHNRRWMFPEWYRKGIFVDKEDDILMHADPAGDYIKALANGVVRLKNDVVHNAFFADVKGGKNPGDDTYSFNADTFSSASEGGRVIPHDCADEDFAKGGTSSGLTLNKLQMATRAFGELKVNLNGPRYIACTHKHINDLIFEAKTQSLDTSPLQSLALGNIRQWGGWTFIIDYNITKGTNNDLDSDTSVYKLPVWVPQGMLFAQHNVPQFSIDRIPRKGLYVFQIAAQCGMNAIRMDEDRVLQIETI